MSSSFVLPKPWAKLFALLPALIRRARFHARPETLRGLRVRMISRHLFGPAALTALVALSLGPACARVSDGARPDDLLPGLPYLRPVSFFLPAEAAVEGRQINVATAGRPKLGVAAGDDGLIWVFSLNSGATSLGKGLWLLAAAVDGDGGAARPWSLIYRTDDLVLGEGATVRPGGFWLGLQTRDGTGVLKLDQSGKILQTVRVPSFGDFLGLRRDQDEVAALFFSRPFLRYVRIDEAGRARKEAEFEWPQPPPGMRFQDDSILRLSEGRYLVHGYFYNQGERGSSRDSGREKRDGLKMHELYGEFGPDSHYPRFGVDRTGNIWAVWRRWGSERYSEVYLVLSPDGSPLYGPSALPIEPLMGGDEAVFTDARGDVWIAYWGKRGEESGVALAKFGRVMRKD